MMSFKSLSGIGWLWLWPLVSRVFSVAGTNHTLYGYRSVVVTGRRLVLYVPLLFSRTLVLRWEWFSLRWVMYRWYQYLVTRAHNARSKLPAISLLTYVVHMTRTYRYYRCVLYWEYCTSYVHPTVHPHKTQPPLCSTAFICLLGSYCSQGTNSL